MFLSVVVIFAILESFSLLHGVPVFEPVGCFQDSGISPRPMPLLLKDFRPGMNWNNIDAVIKQCAGLTHSKSLIYFGLKYYGQCWSGATAGKTYSRDGPAESCVKGVGVESTFFVYKFYDYSYQVPGCNAAWKAQNDFCFIVISKHSSTWNETKNYCQESGGQLMHATDKSTSRLLEQFLYTIQLNSESSSTQCIVTGPANTSSFSTLPLDKQSVSNSTTHICAIRSSNQWKLQGCSVNNCDELCIAPRDTSPVAGTFVQHATDSAVTGHVITSMLVDDATACARECLLYRNCASFNYEYVPTAGRELSSSGMICELNDETRNSHDVQLRKRRGYNYYERLQM